MPRKTTASNAATESDQPVSSDQPADAQDHGTPITMPEFERLPDRGNWLTVKEAAAKLSSDTGAAVDPVKLKNAVRNRAEFKAPGSVYAVSIPGYDMRPLTYVSVEAISAYQANNASGIGTRAARVIANGKRWIVRVKEQDREAVAAALAPFGIVLEVASAAHKPKVKATDAGSDNASNNGAGADHNDGGAPVDMFAGDAETMAANAEGA